TVLCRAASCAPAEVQVSNLPPGSFYASRETGEIDRAPYAGTETVAWQTRNLRRGLAFAYIPAPFHLLRGVLAPLLGASNVSQWATGLLGMVGGAAAIPLIKPLVQDIAEEKASKGIGKAWDQRKKKSQQPPRKAK